MKKRITIPGKGRYPDACFDHIFARNLGRPVASVLKATPASDHWPVVVDVVAERWANEGKQIRQEQTSEVLRMNPPVDLGEAGSYGSERQALTNYVEVQMPSGASLQNREE